MHIIGINGFKRSGKGEVGKAIDRLVSGVHQVGFADKLKIIAARSLGYLDETEQECIALMDEAKEKWVVDVRRAGNNHKVTHLTMREYLQNLGNEARKVFGEDFWIDQVLPEPAGYASLNRALLSERYPNASVVAITDLRYPNEAQRVQNLGGCVIEVLRPGLKSDGHASEQPLPRNLVNYHKSHDRNLQQLCWEVNKVLEWEGILF